MRVKGLLKLFDIRFAKFLLKHSLNRVRKTCELYRLLKNNPTLKIEEDVQIKSPDRLKLGKSVLIQKGTVLHCGGMKWCNYQGSIEVGDRCSIGPNCILYGAGGIVLENDVALAFDVKVIAQEEDLEQRRIDEKGKKRLVYQQIVIKKRSSVTSGAIILAGSTIGKDCIIGPGAVVKGEVPDNSLVLGNPGRVIKKLP